jgi:hypothetical protein
MPVNNKQAISSVSICQKLTTTYCSIELFRFDETRQVIYILAITPLREEIEIIIDRDGEINFQNG